MYTLLAASTGEYIEDYKNGLGMVKCLDWLLKFRGKGTLVSFSFYYDTTMCLLDASPQALKSLSLNGFCHIEGGPKGTFYRIEYLKRKVLTISLRHRRNGKPETCRDQSGQVYRVKIYDVFGFFQTRFPEALMQWGISTRSELEEMERMKANRENFASEHPDTIRAYNYEECVSLVALMDKLADRLNAVGLHLTSWHGAGAVANAVLAKHRAQDYLPKSEAEIIRHAYFGGRIQCLQLGNFPETFSYDLRSAYPWAMANLPRFLDIEPIPKKTLRDHDIARISWKTTAPITPFPWRQADGGIQFHSEGEGYYHACEIQAAQEHGVECDVKEVWRIPYNDEDKPFSWIQDYYAYRAVLREMGDYAHIAVKLALNSLYGKTAQKFGFRGKAPRYRSYMIAGSITAHCRAALYKAAMQNPDAIIMFATDGIASEVPLDLPLGTELGEWERTDWDSLDVYQSGFYRFGKKDQYAVKTRSIHPQWVDWDYCRTQWEDFGTAATLCFNPRQFVTFGIASENLPVGQWLSRPKAISLLPKKGIGEPIHNGRFRLRPLPAPEGVLSKAYAPRLPNLSEVDEPMAPPTPHEVD